MRNTIKKERQLLLVSLFFLCFYFLFFGSAEEESENGEGTIEKEDFETEFVTEKEFD